MTAAAGALRIETLNDIGEEAELQSFARAHEPAVAPGAANGTEAGAKKRQFAYSRDPNERVALNKDAMELEIKQMRGFNREVYESRVRQKYLEERVCRALYTQKLAWRRHEKLDVQRIRQQERIAREVAAKTPYLRDKAREEQRKQMEDNERARGAPRFHDIASIEERLANANLLARGVAPSDRVAHPATAYELTVRETRRLPPNGSLLNPRNQCTSPLPDRSLLLPYEYPPDDEEGGSAKSVQTLRALVAQLVPLFDVKRNADLVAERSGRPRPRLLDALREHLTMRGLREVEVREKLAELRNGCKLHAEHPKVSIFRAMAGWGEGATSWDATRSSACLLLMLLLKPSADEATKVSQRFSPTKGHISASTVELAPMVQLDEVDTLLGYLQRKKVLTKGSVLILREMAHRLETPPPPPPAPSPAGPQANLDKVMWRWMSDWGKWHYEENSELLFSIISKFQPPSPSKSGSRSRSSPRLRAPSATSSATSG